MPARSSATISSSSWRTSARTSRSWYRSWSSSRRRAAARRARCSPAGRGRVGSLGPPAALHQPAERLAEVALGHDVVGERVEDLVGVEGRDRLRAVPARVSGGPSEERIATGRRRPGASRSCGSGE